MLYKLFRKMKAGFFVSAFIAMGVAVLYGIMTGFSFSTIRAVIMLGLSIGGELVGRKYDMLTAMGLVLCILLIANPFRLMDGGLVLSFAAVAGVVCAKYLIKLLERHSKLFRRLRKKKTTWIYSMISAVIFSLSISVITMPFVAYMYYQIPLYSVLINLLVVPLMSVTVFCGFLGVLIYMISPLVGTVVIWPGVLSLKLYSAVCELVQRLPFSNINTGQPSLVQMIIYFLMIGVGLILINPRNKNLIRNYIKKHTKRQITKQACDRIVCVVIVVTVVIGSAGIGMLHRYNNGEKMVFLDVGQGDGILIRSPVGTNMVIDIGSTSDKSLGEYVACPGLLSVMMGHIDYWFITHMDEDHISALMYILQQDVDIGINIDNIVVSQVLFEENNEDTTKMELISLAKKKGINIIYMKAGEYISDGSFEMRAIHPDKDFFSEDKNDNSLVLSYKSKKLKALFLGDVGTQGIDAMLGGSKGFERLADYDIIKVPHHGSKYSASEELLEITKPEVAIVSCGAYNLYGHPHREVLELYEKYGVVTYRTDMSGAIIIE